LSSEGLPYLGESSTESSRVLLVLPDGVGVGGLLLHLQVVDDVILNFSDETLFVTLKDGILGTPVMWRKKKLAVHFLCYLARDIHYDNMAQMYRIAGNFRMVQNFVFSCYCFRSGNSSID
jgi:hypothetical protein